MYFHSLKVTTNLGLKQEPGHKWQSRCRGSAGRYRDMNLQQYMLARCSCHGCFLTHCLNNEEHSPKQTGCSAETQLQILHTQRDIQHQRSDMEGQQCKLF